MTLTLTMLLRAEGAPAAKGALDGLVNSTDRLGMATTRGAAADRVAAGAKRLNAQASGELARQNQIAAGATGSLVAQFNDIGMMMAAGQNPLQLAIQQGTQITQIIGPMGAGGAVKALGTAFRGMFSLVNLGTLAAIAGGAALIQWLTSVEEKADAVGESFAAIAEATTKTQGDIDKLRFGVDEQYQVDLLKEQIRLRDEINLRVAEATRVAATFANDERGRAQYIADTNIELAGMAARYNEIGAALSLQQNRATQLAIIEGQRAQTAGELVAKEQQAAQAAAALQVKVQAVVSALASADGSRLVAAFQSAFPVASQLLGMAQSIVSTIGAASAQAAAMQSAETSGLAAQYAQYGAGRTIGERLARESGSLYGGRRVIPAPVAAGGVGAGGGGGAAARDEANALQELIESLEGEIEALRVQDPIQQEMLKHREALANATEAERKKVEELIAVREREAAALDAAKQRKEFFEGLGNNALEALIVKGESFNDVLKNIAQSLIQAGIQAALFGTGPFGSLFGGTSIMTQLFPGLAAKAEGGMINGPGSGTSDSILTRLSNGEFVVNAKATARNRHLLEAINAGSLPGYAAGGMVGADNRRGAARGEGGATTIVVDVRGAQGNTEVREMVRQGVQVGLQLYDREALPRSVQRVSADRKRVN